MGHLDEVVVFLDRPLVKVPFDLIFDLGLELARPLYRLVLLDWVILLIKDLLLIPVKHFLNDLVDFIKEHPARRGGLSSKS